MKLRLLTSDMPSMSSWMRSVWLYCRMARPTRKMISRPYGHVRRCYRRFSSTEHTVIIRMFPTSYMKISKMRVATGKGRKVRKRVRNQEEAYMDVWKLWERKWTFSSGSCSCGNKKSAVLKPQITQWVPEEELMHWRYKRKIMLPLCGQDAHCKPSASSLPAADIQTGRCRDPAQPCWVWTVPSDGTPASVAQKHRTPPPLASGEGEMGE